MFFKVGQKIFIARQVYIYKQNAKNDKKRQAKELQFKAAFSTYATHGKVFRNTPEKYFAPILLKLGWQIRIIIFVARSLAYIIK